MAAALANSYRFGKFTVDARSACLRREPCQANASNKDPNRMCAPARRARARLHPTHKIERGRRLRATESVATAATIAVVDPLQWGRRPRATERSKLTAGTNVAVNALQWGRRPRATERLQARTIHRHRPIASMGPSPESDGELFR